MFNKSYKRLRPPRSGAQEIPAAGTPSLRVPCGDRDLVQRYVARCCRSCRRRRHSPNNDPRRSKRLAKTSKEKRKMVSGDSSPSRADGASRRPPKKNKLVHAHDESASTVPMGTATATWEKKPAALVFHDFNFGGDNQVSDALRAGLSEHCATGLRFVDRKQLVDTDAKLDQNRLQFSRKSPISRLFTPAELARALEL
jgi:hypothetical protein